MRYSKRLLLAGVAAVLQHFDAQAQVSAPVFSPVPGYYPTYQNVTITGPAGSTIRYTTNGLDPAGADTQYTGPLSIDAPLTLKARAWSGSGSSAVTTGGYAISGGIAAGFDHALALKSDAAKVFSWGSNISGQLGVGNKTATSSIMTVQSSAGGDFTDVAMIAAGQKHSLALTKTGGVYAWGEGANGQLGYTGTNDKTNPVACKYNNGTLLTGMTAVAGGKVHSLVLSSAGVVYGFGANSNGQLGLGDTTQRNGAVQPNVNSTTKLNAVATVRSIACGSTHSLAVTTSNTLYAWGDNSHLELGLAGTNDRLYAKEITSVTGVSEAAGGTAFSLILLTSGGVRSFGMNNYGQLGNSQSNGVDQSAPQVVVESGGGALQNIVQVAAGADFSLALSSSGEVYAWGSNVNGTLGQGTTDSSIHPTAVRVKRSPTELLSNIVRVACGSDFCLALDRDGNIYSWGSSTGSRLGNSTISVPSSVTFATAYNTLPVVTTQPISIRVTAPAPLQAFYALANVTITADVTVQPGASPVSRVDFYSNGNFVGTDSSAPYSLAWNQIYTGDYSITAKAVDTAGGIWSSPNSVFSVLPYTVTITQGLFSIAENSATPAVFTVFRSPNYSDLPVQFVATGSATAGKDYVSLNGTVIVPAGSVSAEISIQPILDSLFESNESVTITLVGGGPVYTVTPSSATVSITDSVPVSAGLALWLRADQGASPGANGELFVWSDQSGNGLIAVADNPPTLLSVPDFNGYAIRFDGVNDSMHLPDGFADFSAGLSAFVVAKPSGAPSYARFFDFGNGPASENIVFARSATTNDLIYRGFSGSTLTADIVAGGVLSSDTWKLYGVNHNANKLSLYENGYIVAMGPGSSVNNIVRTSNLIGKSNWTNDGLFQGDMAEIILFNRSLTDSERVSMENYLGSKYGLSSAVSIPSNVRAIPLSPTQTYVAWEYPSSQMAARFSVERRLGSGDYEVISELAEALGFLDETTIGGNEYTYRVRAYDGGIYSGYSTEVTVTSPTLGVSVPTDGMVVWLSADSSTRPSVSVLHDMSGNGNDAVQTVSGNQPSLVVGGGGNTKPSIRFDGVNDFLKLPAGLSNFSDGLTAFVVANPGLATTNARFFDFGSGTPNNNIILYRLAQSSTLSYRTYTGATTTGDVSATGAIANTSWRIYSVNHGSGKATLLRDGILMQSGAAAAIPTVSRSSNLIAKSNWTSDGYYSGDLSEIIVFNRSLTPTEMHAVERYLNAKYLPPEMDADNDGLSNGYELANGLNPYEEDQNGDGLADGLDVQLGYDPKSGDVDGDGITNAQEIADGTNPLSADSDGDGTNDSLDVFPLDPTRSSLGADPTPGAAPIITLTAPAGAQLN